MGTTSFKDGVFDPNKCAVKCDQMSAYEKQYYNGGETEEAGRGKLERRHTDTDSSDFIHPQSCHTRLATSSTSISSRPMAAQSNRSVPSTHDDGTRRTPSTQATPTTTRTSSTPSKPRLGTPRSTRPTSAPTWAIAPLNLVLDGAMPSCLERLTILVLPLAFFYSSLGSFRIAIGSTFSSYQSLDVRPLHLASQLPRPSGFLF